MNKNKRTKDPRYFLNESSLSRVHEHMMEHDTAAISAFRDDPFDGSKCSEYAMKEKPSEEDVLKVNLRRNKELKASLLSMGYGVTKVMGSYIEGFGSEAAREVSEQSFFVVNLEDDTNFKDSIAMLGERFCQAFETGDFKGGEEAEFMSRVGGRPYTFTEELREEIILETLNDHGRNARWVIRKMSDKVLDKTS